MTSITAQVENLLNFLTYYGNAVGNGLHAVAEGAKHGAAGMGKLLCEIKPSPEESPDFTRPRFHL